MSSNTEFDYDYIIIGSGFGGSASAFRLSEKGYKVLIIEKGKWLNENDFPKSNWNIKRWLWMPKLWFHGPFRISFFRHVAALSGIGVGGGSLIYANTLPVPKSTFFTSGSWSGLLDWENELRPFYDTALKMMGTTQNPDLRDGDLAMKKVAEEIGMADHYEPTDVAVFFGEPEKTVPDPYFNGEGPERAGCNFCGGCMVSCRYNAKNTLDKNYLHLAQKKGAKIQSDSEVYDVIPVNGKPGTAGYRIKWRISTKLLKNKGDLTCRGVVFAGGVLGTIKLLLKLRQSSLPDLSNHIGMDIRTNSESFIGVTTFDKNTVFSDGVAIGSILHTGEHSHLEPVRYPSGSGFWRILMSPMAGSHNPLMRLFQVLSDIIRHPLQNLKALFIRDWAKRTQILMFMQTLNSTLRFSKTFYGLKTSLTKGERPTCFIPEAEDLANRFAKTVNGKPMKLLTETMLGIPTTAHILGGAVMGKDPGDGVIDKNNHVFGYEDMYICDGSAISANPGVNPALSILAITERAMSKIPAKTIS